MSYAGTYGDDETCRHDHYWRSCALCSEIGPRATLEQIEARRQQRERETREAQQAELKRQEMYAELSLDEKKVAEAFWASLLKSYPGVGDVSLDAAVRRQDINSWAIGKARSICNQARTAVEALK